MRNWDTTIERNKQALKGIVETLFLLLGLSGDTTVARIQPSLRRAVLRILRPAESALRRLIVVAAIGVVVKPSPFRLRPAKPVGKKGQGSTRLSFQLFDPRKTFKIARGQAVKRISPRITFFSPEFERVIIWPAPPPVPKPQPAPAVALPTPAPVLDGLVDGERLSLRLQALKLALDDLPAQARRLVRWRARREAAVAVKFTSALRRGRPPGHQREPEHDVDFILTECHRLAWEAVGPDTS